MVTPVAARLQDGFAVILISLIWIALNNLNVDSETIAESDPEDPEVGRRWIAKFAR